MSAEQEVWVSLDEIDGLYEVSNRGFVRNTATKHVLKACKNRGGYLQVVLCNNGFKKTCSVHQLVARAFIPNPNNYVEINHIDENKENNSVENLEWCSRLHNLTHGTARKRAAKSKSIPVIQYLDDVEIARFDSLKQAGEKTKCCPGHICQCCRGNPSHSHVGGFTFRYA